ncbi:hypothetical protein [Phytobacter diazotrophicus]|uniref:hypothetical protein n=1 Tax=Phytobacter diazotrophicus TaxID=395631 RepID=UPI002FFC33A0
MKLIDLLVQELPKRGGWPEKKNWSRLNDFILRNKLTITVIGDCFYFEDWDGDKVTREQYEAASQKIEWEGIGLPPVGCECEYQDSNTNKWYPVTIKYVSDQLVVICGITNILGEEQKTEIAKDIICDKPQFRPVCSEADKKRYAAANAMCKVQECPSGEITPDGVARGEGKLWVDVYDAIAAGKIPGVRIE